ncbi:16S rRNA (adenine(1518)-N(6)/adenine(1519)-N(6))-dimethyltransferase RsmA [[Mycoplasma] collis]|uniref:16S rRNA (adenine(1518)-N(6)/adenine(1519)-N(6))- dimethyltransferase RsmA n=1 Tax=[Mycoplasma] collis TaxID=2127 RepID=UPI00051BF814|nr:16S rRNA (adenine(1518)-N(6)/adenine(1519)-N(6))-dimethyltransferase RsmA [[Mycoplasma] collis]
MIDKNIKAKKNLGQNFLINKDIIKKIVKISKIDNKEVIEIGPGQGALTTELIKTAKTLVAYEIDKDMINVLEKNINNEKFSLINEDFLKSNLKWKGKKILVANLPYYITSKIVFKIFENINLFERMIIMVQKEVAERIIAKVNDFNYNKLSVVCQYVADIKKEIVVKANNFLPIPKVDSVVLSFNFKKNINQEYLNSFFYFIKKCFAMRRKTFFNNLKLFLDNKKINQIFMEFDLSKNIRPQEINLEKYINIFNFLYQ